MPGGEPAQAGRNVPAEASATATKVLWPSVTGAQLEELLYGLFESMGASSLTWRAGSVTGVTASDGGRDLEAVFDRPSPDGELDRQRWWVECKGRTETVERSAVQQAVLDASARPDVDVLVVATNSRFSNPTRDWVNERTDSFARPIVKLWDKDHLDRLVRQHPTVVARVLPKALPDEDRLRLLVKRFEEIGEEPTQLDLNYFWERRDWLMQQESQLRAEAMTAFLYTEGLPLPRERQWWRLLCRDDIEDALIAALLNLPRLLFLDQLPRPVEEWRVLASAGRIVIACLIIAPQSAIPIALNPWKVIADGEDVAKNEELLEDWHKGLLRPVLAFIQSDLVSACSSDCLRVSADNPHETDRLSDTEFWKALFEGATDPRFDAVINEYQNEPCTVGLNMNAGCPLVVSNDRDDCRQLLQDFGAILQFRHTVPTDRATRPFKIGKGPSRMTVVEDHGQYCWILDDHKGESKTSQDD